MIFASLRTWLWEITTEWLTKDKQSGETPFCDFERLSYEVRPCDVLLVEGRSRVSEIIKIVTQSSWTHTALYIGRLHDIDSPALRERISRFYKGDASAQLVIEALLGRGTVVTPLTFYKDFHLRICRPTHISRQDAQQVISVAVQRLGTGYDVRQLLDLARFMFPYGLLPRHWRSSLFAHNAGDPTRCICSTMMVEAFQSVHYPVLPVVRQAKSGDTKLYKRNPRLHSPKDFDYSPYFDIIKYPFMGAENLAIYRQLPWSADGMVLNDSKDNRSASATDDKLADTR